VDPIGSFIPLWIQVALLFPCGSTGEYILHIRLRQLTSAYILHIAHLLEHIWGYTAALAVTAPLPWLGSLAPQQGLVLNGLSTEAPTAAPQVMMPVLHGLLHILMRLRAP
jgi:hypothetical protein